MPRPRWRAARRTSPGWPRRLPRWTTWTGARRSAGPAPGWSTGASRWRRTSARATRTRLTGVAQSAAGASRDPGCSSWAWPRRPTAATAPVASSPGTAAGTCCGRPCSGPGWPPPRCPPPPTTPSSWWGRGSRCRCAARRRPTSPPPRSGTPAPHGWTASWSWCCRRCGSSSRWGPSGGRRLYGRCVHAECRCPHQRPPSGTGPRSSWGRSTRAGSCCSAAST